MPCFAEERQQRHKQQPKKPQQQHRSVGGTESIESFHEDDSETHAGFPLGPPLQAFGSALLTTTDAAGAASDRCPGQNGATDIELNCEYLTLLLLIDDEGESEGESRQS